MKIVIVGAGSVAFAPAILSGLCSDRRYAGATIGLIDIDKSALQLVGAFASRISKEFGQNWTVETSTNRRDVLPGADIVTTSIGVGGVEAWQMDLDIPYKYGVIQPVGDTSGPGGLARALRHIPVHVEIARDMEELCPKATLYNFTNPLTVITQAINSLTNVRCIGLCIGPDLTWSHLCRVVGVEKQHTTATIGGINHCHWITDFRIGGRDAFPLLAAALDELQGNPRKAEEFRAQFGGLVKRPQEPSAAEPLCTRLFRKFGAYPGPGDGHVAEFFPQLMPGLIADVEHYQGEAIKHVYQSYPKLREKMMAIGTQDAPIDAEDFARELSWEHTQFLEILVAQQDDLGQLFHVNIPNKGYIHNLPDGAVVEVPAKVDRAGLHPFALGDLPDAIVPVLTHKLASLKLIIEAAMEGSREKAVQAFLNDPHCTDIDRGVALVNELIDAQAAYLPRFH
jgi:alpha-galactosidase